MEVLLGLLAVGLAVGFPVAAIVALVRTVGLRRSIEENYLEFRDKISDLNGEIVRLKREVGELSRRVDRQDAVSSPASAVENSEPVSAPESASAPSEQVVPVVIFQHESAPPVSVVHANVVDQAAVTMPPPIAPKRAEPCPASPQAEPAANANHPKPSVGIPAATIADATSDDDAAWLRHINKQGTFPRTPGTSIKDEYAQFIADRIKSRTAVPLSATPNVSSEITRKEMPEAMPPRKSFAERLRSTLPLEELLGMNLFAKIGIVLLVIGIAFGGQMAFTSMSAGARVVSIYAIAGVLLAGGIWFETKERYRIVGRAGIGGGWATLFFVTYAMNHLSAMQIMPSVTLNCILMFVVAIGMVAHTLRYKSQVVTGLAFLLAFSTVALGQDSVYALTAGVVLAAGIVTIALRMSWFELEVFGILASYANHFYWLYKLFPDGVAGHAFPQFWPSAIILIFYWAIFRVSYVARSIQLPRDEAVSTIAALLNTMLLGAVMKFQSTRPELAFYGILAIGVAEFIFGQLPLTRRRRPAFILLTVMGTMLAFASVPFKYSGNSIAFFWMIAAEVLLIAGIQQKEILFRRLGLIAGFVTGLLVVYEAWDIVGLRQSSNAPRIQDGILLLTCSALFYLNALLIHRRWKPLFGSIDGPLAIVQSYIGCATAFLGAWCIFTGDWTAISWAVLMLGAAIAKKYLDDNHLLAQGAVLFVAAWYTSVVVNCHLDDFYPHHIVTRLITLPILALVFYGAAWTLSAAKDIGLYPRRFALWAGTSLLALLVWFEVAPAWVAPIWMALAVALVLIARRIRLADFAYQSHLLSVAVGFQLIAVNLYAQTAMERYLPFLGCAAAFYAISRFCTLRDAQYLRPAAWMHTWAATALIATLVWNESPQLWLAAIWAVFALALAITDRIFDIEELPYQAHLLAFFAVLRAVTVNLYSLDQWRGVSLRLITVSILIAVLYILARWVRMPEAIKDPEARHVYTWIGSSISAWLMWSELQSISVAVGLAIFGLVLFELGSIWKQKQLRLQAYVALTAAFGRIFFVNLTAATLPGETISPRVYTVVPIALIYFYVWSRMQSEQESPEIGLWAPRDLIAYFGTGSVVALAYFQTPVEWVVVAWAALALVLVIAEWALNKQVFLQQAILLAIGVVGRGLAHNIFGGSYFTADGWRGNYNILSIASALLLLALPIAFRLRKRYAELSILPKLSRLLALKHPEQWFFYAPVVLITFMIAIKMNPGMVTLSWGVEGVVVIMLGLFASERSYRITGLFLLLLCVGKILALDIWQLNGRDRYLTLMVLGAALILVSILYSKFRETVRRLL
jgi:hypothetical protein